MNERMSWFNWLPLSDRKNIDIPRVYVEEYDNQFYGGYYQFDEKNSYIVVVDRPDAVIESVLAHEFRHHIQAVLNQHYYQSDATILSNDVPYEQMIRTYFRTQPNEFDALLYEHKYAKSELNDWWLNHLVKVENYV